MRRVALKTIKIPKTMVSVQIEWIVYDFVSISQSNVNCGIWIVYAFAFQLCYTNIFIWPACDTINHIQKLIVKISIQNLIKCLRSICGI